MTRKLALKRLKSSDLSFFQTYLRQHAQTKQKSFNLDRRVIEGELFPSLSEVVEALPDKRALVALTFFGPSMAGPHSLARKILKQEKNWRLNGEVVHNPDEHPTRYDVLAPDDYVILEFFGSGAPSAVKAVLIAAGSREDASVHAAIRAHFPTSSMRALSDAELEQIVASARPPLNHPLLDWLDRELMEDVGQGGGRSAEQLNRRRRGRGISLGELQTSKAAAERTGLLGEELLNHFFQSTPPVSIEGHEWVSQVNAISPFDFRLDIVGGSTRHLDAKSTSGSFDNPIHLSLSEIIFATKNDSPPYDIYRLYEVREGFARLRVAKNIGPRLANVVAVLENFPENVEPDSLSFKPEFFEFELDEQVIEIPEEPAET